MDRRQFLAGLGTAGSAALAGCYALRPDEPPSDVRDVPEIDDDAPTNLDEAGPVQRTWTVGPTFAPTFGDHEPHRLAIRNVTDAERPYELRIVRWSGNAVLDATGTLAAQGRVEVTLRGPANYSAVVRSGDHEGRVDVPQSTFDCNTSWTAVAVGDDRLGATTVSTQMACGTSWP